MDLLLMGVYLAARVKVKVWTALSFCYILPIRFDPQLDGGAHTQTNIAVGLDPASGQVPTIYITR